jgi:hypothetical protein
MKKKVNLMSSCPTTMEKKMNKKKLFLNVKLCHFPSFELHTSLFSCHLISHEGACDSLPRFDCDANCHRAKFQLCQTAKRQA